MNVVEFYFDFISPYSYFAWSNIHQLQQRLHFQIKYLPTPLGPLLSHFGQKGPGEIKSKRELLFRRCLRYSAQHKIPFTTPLKHPFNSIYALRLSLPEVSGEKQKELIQLFWQMGWQEGRDLGDPQVLENILKEIS